MRVTLFLSRLVGAESSEPYIVADVEAPFRGDSKFNVTDAYFVPVAWAQAHLLLSPD